MFSKILIKLIDQTILPAVLVLASRVVSLIVISRLNGIPFELTKIGFVFNNTKDYIALNSYSMLTMFIILALGMGYVLIKSYLFHNTHIKPWISAKLFSLKLPYFIQDSFELYTQGAIWLSYSFIITTMGAFMLYVGVIYPWVFYIGFFSFVISTILLIMDIEHEIKIKKSNEVILDTEVEYILKETYE